MKIKKQTCNALKGAEGTVDVHF